VASRLGEAIGMVTDVMITKGRTTYAADTSRVLAGRISLHLKAIRRVRHGLYAVTLLETHGGKTTVIRFRSRL
jgi:hypothetical protein